MSFIQTVLATALGVFGYYVLEAVYYAILSKVKERQVQTWWNEFEEEHWDDD
jgi:hypothetical protein